MPQPCSICHHPELRAITAALMERRPYRELEQRFGLSKSAIDRHVARHISKALRQLAVAENMSIAEAAVIAEPVLVEMRKLNARALRILTDAEGSKDNTTALHAVREVRRNLELIAKLTGELDPRTPGETPGTQLNVTVNYVEKQAIVTAAPEAARALIAEGESK